MANPRPWPFDDDDRPNGSVQPLSQADLQAILAHLGDDPDQLLAGTIGDRPVAAMRVRASLGRPGGSAHAQRRRLRAAEWAAWTRTAPWRAAAILAGTTVGGLLGPPADTEPGAGPWRADGHGGRLGLRFRPSPDALAWQRGAAGERRTARLLDPSGRLCHGRHPSPHTTGGGLRSRPDRPGPARPGRGRGADRGRARRPGAMGQGGQRRGCRWWRPGACQACFVPSRRCWGPSGSPGWPTRPGSASALLFDPGDCRTQSRSRNDPDIGLITRERRGPASRSHFRWRRVE
jgi:hypothetical protein